MQHRRLREFARGFRPSDFTIKILPWSVVSTDEYSKHHPFKQLPYMVDEEKGIELYESRSMIKCEPI